MALLSIYLLEKEKKKKKRDHRGFFINSNEIDRKLLLLWSYSRMGVYPHSSEYLTEMHKPSLRCCPKCAAPVLSVTGSSEQTLRNSGLDVTYLFSLQLLPILEDPGLGSLLKLPL